MKRIVSLLVVVLGSAFVLYAEDANRDKAITEQVRYSECVAESANRAACDQPIATRDVEVTSVDDGNVFKAAAESNAEEPIAHVGSNMGSADGHQQKKVWPDFIYDSQ